MGLLRAAEDDRHVQPSGEPGHQVAGAVQQSIAGDLLQGHHLRAAVLNHLCNGLRIVTAQTAEGGVEVVGHHSHWGSGRRLGCRRWSGKDPNCQRHTHQHARHPNRNGLAGRSRCLQSAGSKQQQQSEQPGRGGRNGGSGKRKRDIKRKVEGENKQQEQQRAERQHEAGTREAGSLGGSRAETEHRPAPAQNELAHSGGQQHCITC